jgi:hypothetical protein
VASNFGGPALQEHPARGEVDRQLHGVGYPRVEQHRAHGGVGTEKDQPRSRPPAGTGQRGREDSDEGTSG